MQMSHLILLIVYSVMTILGMILFLIVANLDERLGKPWPYNKRLLVVIAFLLGAMWLGTFVVFTPDLIKDLKELKERGK